MLTATGHALHIITAILTGQQTCVNPLVDTAHSFGVKTNDQITERGRDYKGRVFTTRGGGIATAGHEFQEVLVDARGKTITTHG